MNSFLTEVKIFTEPSEAEFHCTLFKERTVMNFWHMNKGQLSRYYAELHNLLEREQTEEPKAFRALQSKCGELQQRAIDLGLQAQIEAIKTDIGDKEQ